MFHACFSCARKQVRNLITEAIILAWWIYYIFGITIWSWSNGMWIFEGILVLIQSQKQKDHDVTIGWRHEADVMAWWRQLATRLVSTKSLILATQICRTRFCIPNRANGSTARFCPARYRVTDKLLSCAVMSCADYVLRAFVRSHNFMIINEFLTKQPEHLTMK